MTEAVLITHQPVLNRQRAITANRLIFHAADQCESPEAAIAECLNELGDIWPSERSVFVSLAGILPTIDLMSWQAPDNTMVEIPAAGLGETPTAGLARALETAGVSMCLDGYTPELRLPPSPSFHFLLADVTHVQRVRGAPGLTIACNLADASAFDAALSMGFDGAAGWFFLKGRTASTKLVPSHAQIVRLLGLVRRNAEIREIEAVLKQDVALSYKLLRYINSAGFGLSCEIQSFRHAVTILGFDKLHKWLSLLLVTSSRDPAAPALMQAAIVRGRFMELIGTNYFERSELDNLFITGAFSLLEVLLGTTLQKVLEEMNLPEPICEALLQGEGMYGDFLGLALACERGDCVELSERAATLGISADELNRAQLRAISFADSLQFS